MIPAPAEVERSSSTVVEITDGEIAAMPGAPALNAGNAWGHPHIIVIYKPGSQFTGM